MAESIARHEGFFIANSIAQRNNSPGNIVFGELAKKHGATKFWKHPKTKHEFAIFPTLNDGWAALEELLTNAMTGKSKIYSPDMTILQFFTKYSPVRNSKGEVISNVNYAADVAKRVGVSINTKIKDLLETEETKPMFTQFNQLDYPKVYLGNTTYTVARWGCLSLVINMGYNFMFGKNVQPPEMVKILTYDSNGFLQWPSISILGIKKVVDIRKTATPYEAIKKAYKNPNQMAILEVNNGAHFVLLWGSWWPGLGYRIIDPVGGKSTFTGTRGYRITGVRVVEKV